MRGFPPLPGSRPEPAGRGRRSRDRSAGRRAPVAAEPAPARDQTQPAPDEGSDPVADEPALTVSAPGRAVRPEASARRRAAAVTWVQGDDGGSRITRQIVRVYRGTTRIGAFTIPGDVTGVRVTGLRPGKVYRFSVIAKNAFGKSAESRRSNKVRPRR